MTTQPITFLWGHPVPYSLTVQRNGRSIGARPHLEAIRYQFRRNVPDRETIITKVEGPYVWYDYMPEGWERPRLSFAAIDLGFDPRVHKMACEYPDWAGDGPVLLTYGSRGTETPSQDITRKCDSRAEALRILRRHGYRITIKEPEKPALRILRRYRVVLPNDYGSDVDAAALVKRFPGLEGSDLQEAAFDEIRILWPGLRWVEDLDFGAVFASDTPPPKLPPWVWVSEVCGAEEP